VYFEPHFPIGFLEQWVVMLVAKQVKKEKIKPVQCPA